ncbi:hypothetical protein Ct61P_01957 [Colletotrichum tofieldiae]|nr:hypothetical protein Ct61P_01957 [Colletotrichum tofieldiae]
MLLDAGIVVPRLFNTIQFLNEKSAEIEAKDKYGGTALSFAYPGGASMELSGFSSMNARTLISLNNGVERP